VIVYKPATDGTYLQADDASGQIKLTEHFILAQSSDSQDPLNLYSAVRLEKPITVEGVNVSTYVPNMYSPTYADVLGLGATPQSYYTKDITQAQTNLPAGTLLLFPFNQAASAAPASWSALLPYQQHTQNLQRVEYNVTGLCKPFSSMHDAVLQKVGLEKWTNKEQKQAHLQDIKAQLKLNLIAKKMPVIAARVSLLLG
jgi:hypothetical protein